MLYQDYFYEDSFYFYGVSEYDCVYGRIYIFWKDILKVGCHGSPMLHKCEFSS